MRMARRMRTATWISWSSCPAETSTPKHSRFAWRRRHPSPWTSWCESRVKSSGGWKRESCFTPRSCAEAKFFMKKATREWVRKAEADYRLAAKLARENEPFYDHRCFLCQQSSEKYLKALLEELAIPVAKTHDLERLLNALLPHYPRMPTLRRGLRFLTDFAVEPRYPGEWSNKRQAGAAFRWASKVRDACRSMLGLPPPRRRP